MKPLKNKEIESYVDGLTNFQKEIVLAIREVVLSVDEDVKDPLEIPSSL